MAPAPSVVQPNTTIVPIAASALGDLHTKLYGQVPFSPNDQIIPMALRWRVNTSVGIPTGTFTLWRLHRKTEVSPSRFFPAEVGGGEFKFAEPFFQVMIQLNNPSLTNNLSVTLSPLNHRGELLPLLWRGFNIAPRQSVNVEITYPNLGGFRVSVPASLSLPVLGISMKKFIERPEWEKCQLVGLPSKKTEIPAEVYDPGKQGFTSNLKDPLDASRERVDTMQVFYKTPVPPAGIELQDWKTPNGDKTVVSLRTLIPTPNGSTGMVSDVLEMLKEVVGNPKPYDGLQQNYTKIIEHGGFSEEQGGGQSGNFQKRVLGLTLLNAGTDAWMATGLGFGATEFPKFFQKNDPKITYIGDYFDSEFYYMVTANFRTPHYKYTQSAGGFPFNIARTFDRFEINEYVAVAKPSLRFAIPLTDLLTEQAAEVRPSDRNEPYREAIRVSWKKPIVLHIQSYALALRTDMASPKTRWLNPDRVLLEGMPQPFLPTERADGLGNDPNTPVREKPPFQRFIHQRSPLPFAGSRQHMYFIAGLDVFGRWAQWRDASWFSQAKPPQQPLVAEAKFLPMKDFANLPVLPNRLEFVLAWDWTDRSPNEIVVSGKFLPDAAFQSGFDIASIVQTNGLEHSAGAAGSVLHLAIRFTGVTPRLVTPGTDTPIPESQAKVSFINADGEVRHYKIELFDVQTGFNDPTASVSNANDRVAYAVYAKSSEQVNPEAFSAYTAGLICKVLDPRPKPQPILQPAQVEWAAMPDAANRARFHLKFPAVTGEVRYIAYRATEAKLRDLVGLPPLSNLSPTLQNGLVARATQLRDLPTEAKTRAKDAFIRVNNALLPQPETELDLPGDLDGLYIFAVTTVSRMQVESGFSNWVFVGVPQLATPGAPSLEFRYREETENNRYRVELLVEPDPTTDLGKLELFRVRSPFLAADLDTMGPPIASGPTHPTWEALNEHGVIAAAGERIVRFRVVDFVPKSWHPYFYRAVAFGTEDLAVGKLPGRSAPSNLIEVRSKAPAALPQIGDASLSAIGTSQLRLTFRTDAEIRSSSVFGDFEIEIRRRSAANAFYESFDPQILAKTSAIAQTPQSQTRVFSRSRRDAQGFCTYGILFDYAESADLEIIVSDPLKRSNRASVTFVEAPFEVILRNLEVRRFFNSIDIVFRCNIDNKLMPMIKKVKVQVFAIDPNEQRIDLIDLLFFTDIPAIRPPGARKGIFQKDQPFERLHIYQVFAQLLLPNQALLNPQTEIVVQVIEENGKKTNLNSSGNSRPGAPD